MALTATNFCDTIHRHIGSACRDTIVKTFYPTASVSYVAGDFVTIDSNGRVVKVSTDDTKSDGVIFSSVDNSSGAADNTAKMVPVLMKGNVFCDFLCEATSGTYDDAFAIGTQCSVAGDSGTTAAEGQALVALASASNKNFTSLSIHALPSSGKELVKGLAFFQGSGKFV